ncbi:DnrO protein [Frateuria sp. YIM B11624]|uniref:DnrO protein n=1 Tax=Frateuria sp. YIM B11624 TaxID=3143185 RepID=UPI003C7865DE
MSSIKIAAALFATLAAALAPGAVRAQHDHAAHAHVAQPVPPPSERWAADAVLRDGMGRIHTALEELRHYEMGHMDATMALDRVGLIEQAATDIFARCKLAPEQDAVLHGMLVPLLGAAQKLKADPQDMAQVQAMRKTVADYPRYFGDPGWAAPAAHAH